MEMTLPKHCWSSVCRCWMESDAGEIPGALSHHSRQVRPPPHTSASPPHGSCTSPPPPRHISTRGTNRDPKIETSSDIRTFFTMRHAARFERFIVDFISINENTNTLPNTQNTKKHKHKT
jgi:hypothetical protein